VTGNAAIGCRLRSLLISGALALALSATIAASAAAHAKNSMHLAVAGPDATVTGFAASKQFLNVFFAPNPCAGTFKSEAATTGVSSFGDDIRGRYHYAFGPDNYLVPVDKYVCVYIRTRKLNAKTLEKAFAPLG
jgi:hypothetical protein